MGSYSNETVFFFFLLCTGLSVLKDIFANLEGICVHPKVVELSEGNKKLKQSTHSSCDGWSCRIVLPLPSQQVPEDALCQCFAVIFFLS